MDLVAVISVIASATVGLSATGVSFYGIHRTAQSARATQLRQRKADSYLEVLRLMEAHAQWLRISASNLEAKSDREYYRYFEDQYDRPLTERPGPDSEAVMRAHVAAFGSIEAKEALRVWLTAMVPINEFFTALPFVVMEANGGAPLDDVQLEPLLNSLPIEAAAREVFAKAAAGDLERN